MRSIALALLMLLTLLTACRSPTSTPLLTATPHVERRTATLQPRAVPATARTVTLRVTVATVAAPVATVASPTALEQYRAWIKEARGMHPYGEPVERMWALMLCESSGDPNIVSDRYYGLFQYQPETWSGDWNPYRDPTNPRSARSDFRNRQSLAGWLSALVGMLLGG